MNRADLQRLTQERLLDAKALLRGKRWSFAYYSAGYAVECALKACVLNQMIHTGFIFRDDCPKPQEWKTHDFQKLIEYAGLTDRLNDALRSNSATDLEFSTNWDAVKRWKSTERYLEKTEAEARSITESITQKTTGVLPWIKKFW